MKRASMNTSAGHLYRTALTVLIALFAYSCNPSQLTEPQHPKHIDESQIEVLFGSSLDEGNVLRAQYDMFDSGDRIGVFATPAKTAFTYTNIYEGANNLPYVTRESAGDFHADGKSIYYPMDGSALRFIAYYPYRNDLKLTEGATSLPVALDVTKQEPFFYSDNLELSRNDDPSAAVLRFRSPYARIELHVKAEGNANILELSAYISGAKKQATFDLIKGRLTIDNDAILDKMMLDVTGDNKSQTITCYLLPTAANDHPVIHFNLGNKSYKYKIDFPLKSQYRYVREITLGTGGDISVDRPTGYLEEAVYKYGEMAPNAQLVKHMVRSTNLRSNNVLTASSSTRNYSIMYDTKHHLPYWVAYPLHKQYLGSSGRNEAWDFDPSLPHNVQPYLKGGGFRGKGTSYDRGHLMPSADRTASVDLNKTTFYFSNMAAQQRQFNQQPWAELENQVRACLNTSSDKDTLFIVVGCIWPKNENELTWVTDAAGNSRGAVAPTHMYKIVLKYTGYNNKFEAASYNMPNVSYSGRNAYTQYVVSIKELEELTGFTFFPDLIKRLPSQDKIDALKSSKNGISKLK